MPSRVVPCCEIANCAQQAPAYSRTDSASFRRQGASAVTALRPKLPVEPTAAAWFEAALLREAIAEGGVSDDARQLLPGSQV
jgi:hypothetical protein